MMLRVTDESMIRNSRTGFSINFLFYLSIEFIIGAVISCILTILSIIKSLLPKPPRDLSGDVVLIVGVSSTLGESLAEEFARGGCSVICVDNDFRSAEEITTRLKSRCNKVKGIGPDYREDERENVGPTMAAYECNMLDRNAIRELAKKVEDEIGGIDILVICAEQPYQHILDTVNTTLMGHFWMVLAFLPFMLQRDRAHIIGITPNTSTQDLGSRALIAGIIETLGQELSNHEEGSHLTFLAISPTIAPSSMRREEQQIAKEVVEAVKRDQCSINWYSKMMYQISCAIYSAITTVSQWLHMQEYDYFF